MQGKRQFSKFMLQALKFSLDVFYIFFLIFRNVFKVVVIVQVSGNPNI